MGATMIASNLQDIKRSTDLSDSFRLLTEIRGLVQEFKRQGPQEPLPTAIVKAACLRVVPEPSKKGIELQIDIDRTDVGVIEDNIMAFIRAHNTGPVGMDVGNVNVGQAGLGAGSAGEASPG